jgi:hypothetical protein
MAMRQQSAVEFMTTYSFAIFTIALVLVAVSMVSLSLGTSPPVYSTCNLQPLVTCQQTLLTYNSVGGYFNFVLIFRNNLGFVMQFPSNAITMTLSKTVTTGSVVNSGGCSPANVPQGSQAICIVNAIGTSQVKQGADTFTQFRIQYALCTNQSSSSCAGGTYNATGYSFQSLSPPYSNLYTVSLSSANGVVVINGESYFNNAVLYLTGGQYISAYSVYAQPNTGYGFYGWTPGGGVTLSSASAQNTLMSISSSGTLSANFH